MKTGIVFELLKRIKKSEFLLLSIEKNNYLSNYYDLSYTNYGLIHTIYLS